MTRRRAVAILTAGMVRPRRRPAPGGAGVVAVTIGPAASVSVTMTGGGGGGGGGILRAVPPEPVAPVEVATAFDAYAITSGVWVVLPRPPGRFRRYATYREALRECDRLNGIEVDVLRVRGGR